MFEDNPKLPEAWKVQESQEERNSRLVNMHEKALSSLVNSLPRRGSAFEKPLQEQTIIDSLKTKNKIVISVHKLSSFQSPSHIHDRSMGSRFMQVPTC